MKKRSGWISVLAIFAISALAYLPLVNQFGYTHDDWYLMYAAGAKGPSVFWDIFSVDRPWRALVMIPAYRLFGGNPLYYNLSAWTFRVLSAVILLWLLRMIWPGYVRLTLLIAVLYIIYPGFLSQPNGIDYQSQMISLAAAMLSLGLTVYAFFEKRRIYKIASASLAILMGIFYLGLVEYEAGFEVMRLFILFILAGRVIHNYQQRILTTVKLWLPYSLITLGFGGWRLFFFHSERGATNTGVQFENLKLYPLQTMYHWSVQVMRDFFNVMINAWRVPLSQLLGFVQQWGIILAILAAGLVLFSIYKLKDADPPADSPQSNFTYEALLLGLMTIIGGLIPIAMANRAVSFPDYSRYALVSSVGVAVCIVTILANLKNGILRNGLIVGFIFISVLTHNANAVKYAQETAVSHMFWWQVSWRIPQFEKNTTLIAYYPAGIIEEDYFVWGPADLIYYPKSQNPDSLQPGVYAAVLDKDAVTKILAMERQQYDNRRTIITYANYRNILVLTQPALNSCVHVLDGSQPEYSNNEWEPIRTIGSYSEIEHVLTNETHHLPPAMVFGSEPSHSWCYYYEKAELARQQGDWDEVRQLGDDARANQVFSTAYLIEWIPFIQAYAISGDFESIKEISSLYHGPYLDKNNCSSLMNSKISAETQQKLESLFCQHTP